MRLKRGAGKLSSDELGGNTSLHDSLNSPSDETAQLSDDSADSFLLDTLTRSILPQIVVGFGNIQKSALLNSSLHTFLSNAEFQATLAKTLSEQILPASSLYDGNVLVKIYNILEESKPKSTSEGLQMFLKVLQLIKTFKGSIVLEAKDIAHAMKLPLKSPAVLRKLLCDNSTFESVIVPPEHFSNTTIANLHHDLCHLNSSELSQLSKELLYQISDDHLVEMLRLQPVNLTNTADKLSNFLIKVSPAARLLD